MIPKVSVITIFYNAEAYLQEAIDSVAAQRFVEWEHILVDDGSTDGSSQIAQAAVAKDPSRVRYTCHSGGDNRGMSASRNLGIAESRADLITFLDADDVWLPHRLDIQFRLLEDKPGVAMAMGASVVWRSWAGGPDSILTTHAANGQVHTAPSLLHGLIRGRITTPSMNAAMIRRDALQEIGGLEDSFQGLFEDQVLFAKLWRRHDVIAHEDVLDKYRQHDDSACAQGFRQGIYHPYGDPNAAHQRFLEWVESYLDDVGDDDPGLRRMLSRATVPYRYPRVGRWLRRLRLALFTVVTRILPHHVVQRLRQALRMGRQRSSPARAVVAALPPTAVSRLRRIRADGPRRLFRGVSWGELRTSRPHSRLYGYDRGTPVDRWYIEAWLARNGDAIRGRCLEIGDDGYTRRFGGAAVDQVDILNDVTGHPQTTFVGSLTDPDLLPSDTFDCMVITQTLHLIDDVWAAVASLAASLRSGGTLLVTLPGITPLTEDGKWKHYWTFTDHSARLLFEESFDVVDIDVFGNLTAATAFLHGLAADELKQSEMTPVDRKFPVTIAVRATLDVGSATGSKGAAYT